MSNYITIDGGTTNTRISLVKDGVVLKTVKFSIGAGNCVNGNAQLKEILKKGIEELLETSGLVEVDVERILASGMITSEFGLVNLPHVSVPAGIAELNDAMYETTLEDVSNIPFVFMRGVKNVCADINDADAMRGEETELMGIVRPEAAVYVLPGSHSKIIMTDDSGRIVDFKTMLTGEMTAALSKNTILKKAVDLGAGYDSEYLLKGYEYCCENGINDALFKVRLLRTIFNATPRKINGFFLGSIYCDEIKYILSLNAPQIIIGGKKEIREAMAVILEKVSDSKICVLSDDEVDSSTALGAVSIYEYN